MERMPRGICTQEFRAQAVSLHEVDRLTVSEAARRLSLPTGTLKKVAFTPGGSSLIVASTGECPS
jgi:hypothetical protein